MLTADELRAAVTSAVPAVALERLAVRELNAGRTRGEVSDAIANLLPAMRELSGYSDEWDDHVTDLVDRLTGWTRPAAQLHPSPAGVNGTGPTPRPATEERR
jgi:hypothetical protein